MNQRRQPLTDAMSESVETSEQLDEIERRLKATRPQPPRLDVAALQRLADNVALDPAVERAPDRQPGRAVSRRERQIGGRVLAIAGSWLCGAAVGAVVMFVLMSGAAPSPTQNDEVGHVEQERPDSIVNDSVADFPADRDPDRLDETPAGEGAIGRELRPSMLTMVRDPLRHTDANYLTDGPTFRVGMYVRQNLEPPMWPIERTAEKEREVLKEGERGHSERSTQPFSAPESRTPVSRRELMQEFLGDTNGVVL